MKYELYTTPNCAQCMDVKKFLGEFKIILPLLIEKNNGGGIEKIAQELDEIKTLFN